GVMLQAAGKQPAYKLIITQPPGAGVPVFTDTQRGQPTIVNPKTTLEVGDFSPDLAGATQPTIKNYDVVRPAPAGFYAGPLGGSQVFTALGPVTTLGRTAPPPTLRVKDQPLLDPITGRAFHSAMTYEVDKAITPRTLPAHNLFLQRLACPYLPYQPD